MTHNSGYHLKPHHKFEREGRKYVADLETNDIIEINDVEWDILSRYGTQTDYQIVEALKKKYKVSSVFEGIKRLEWFGKRGQLLARIPESPGEFNASQPVRGELRLLVPFGFREEESSIDYITTMNRYQLLSALTRKASLETLSFSQVRDGGIRSGNKRDLGKIRIRQITNDQDDTFAPVWYAREGYNGILLLSQLMESDLLYYQVPDIPIVHCIENSQKLQSSLLESLLALYVAQKTNDSLVVKASWMKEWLSEFGIPGKHIHVIPDGINVVESIDKGLAKQHTAAIFDRPMFAERPVVGLVSGFEPHLGAQWISAFARANRHLSIFVYDYVLAKHYKNLPENVVIFRADDEEMSAILPVFFQALDLVCFPAMPGTPLSVVLEAMAYGTPCIAMTKYGLPTEVKGAGVSIGLEWDNFGDFHVSMDQLSATINQGLEPSKMRAEYERIAKGFARKYTWQKAARNIIRLFEENRPLMTRSYPRDENLFRPIFCRRYSSETRKITSNVYRLGVNRYEHLEKALAETLMEQHKSTEVASVFKHFKMESSVQRRGNLASGRGTKF